MRKTEQPSILVNVALMEAEIASGTVMFSFGHKRKLPQCVYSRLTASSMRLVPPAASVECIPK